MNKKNISFFILGAFLILNGGCKSSIPENTEITAETTREYTAVTLEDFLPGISGNIKDYSVQIPAGYEKYVIPSGFDKGEVIWATPEDIKAIFSDTQSYDLSLANSTVFKVAFSSNVGATSENIVSQGVPISETDYSNQGIEDLNFRSGFFHGFQGVPALTMSGVMKDQKTYLAYVYSPVNDLVIFVFLHGDKNGDMSDQDWDLFVKSLEIK